MTERQAQILRTIVENYVATATPVGSLSLSEEFKVSPATIRAEMAQLEQAGYITHPHTSAGRIPTDKGYRYCIDLLNQEQQLAAAKADRVQRALDQRIQSAGESERAIKTAVESLADLTDNVGWATMSNGIYMRGMASLFNQPELFDPHRVREVARLLDSLDEWLYEIAPYQTRVAVYVGTENPVGKNSGCSLIIAQFNSPYSEKSYIGLVGPTRQDYPRSIRLVSHISKMLEETLNG